ncbi:MAG: hypothetical protein ABJA82_12895 [Myxococcales bacterium]
MGHSVRPGVVGGTVGGALRCAVVVLLSSLISCGHFAAVGRGGAVYAIAVDSVNGRKTATTGPISYPACAIQVGDRVAQVWIANDSAGDVESPVVLEGDAFALKDGILVERTWSQAVVHKVTDEELAAGAAVVYVPGVPHPTVVELRFELVRGASLAPPGRFRRPPVARSEARLEQAVPHTHP